MTNETLKQIASDPKPQHEGYLDVVADPNFKILGFTIKGLIELRAYLRQNKLEHLIK